MNKIYITGSKGFIGKHLATFLCNKNFLIKTYNRKQLIKLLNKKCFPKERFKEIILVHLGQSSDTNYKFKKNDLNIVKKLINLEFKHYVYLSSVEIYKEKKYLSKNYSNLEKYYNDYNKLKLLSEKLFSDCSSTILRASNVYGLNLKKKTLMKDIVDQIYNSDKITLNNFNNSIDFIWIDDLVQLIYKVIKKQKKGIYDVGCGENYSSKQIALFFLKLNKIKNYKLIEKNNDKKNKIIKLNINKTNQVFNWKSKTDILQGIKKIIQFNRYG